MLHNIACLVSRLVVMASPDYINIMQPRGPQVTGGFIEDYNEGNQPRMVWETCTISSED